MSVQISTRLITVNNERQKLVNQTVYLMSVLDKVFSSPTFKHFLENKKQNCKFPVNK